MRGWFYQCEPTCVYHGASWNDWCDTTKFVCSGRENKTEPDGSKMINA
eukprot:gene1187-1755_t